LAACLFIPSERVWLSDQLTIFIMYQKLRLPSTYIFQLMHIFIVQFLPRQMHHRSSILTTFIKYLKHDHGLATSYLTDILRSPFSDFILKSTEMDYNKCAVSDRI